MGVVCVCARACVFAWGVRVACELEMSGVQLHGLACAVMRLHTHPSRRIPACTQCLPPSPSLQVAMQLWPAEADLGAAPPSGQAVPPPRPPVVQTAALAAGCAYFNARVAATAEAEAAAAAR